MHLPLREEHRCYPWVVRLGRSLVGVALGPPLVVARFQFAHVCDSPFPLGFCGEGLLLLVWEVLVKLGAFLVGPARVSDRPESLVPVVGAAEGSLEAATLG